MKRYRIYSRQFLFVFALLISFVLLALVSSSKQDHSRPIQILINRLLFILVSQKSENEI